MPAKPNMKGLIQRGAESDAWRPGGGKSLQEEEKELRKEDLIQRKTNPKEFGPLHTRKGWPRPTQKQRRLLEERQFEEDNVLALPKTLVPKLPDEMKAPSFRPKFSKGGMVCREYGKKK